MSPTGLEWDTFSARACPVFLDVNILMLLFIYLFIYLYYFIYLIIYGLFNIGHSLV